MVLQRDKPIAIWGWAPAGEKISIQFSKQVKKTTSGKEGKWKITLLPESAGGPYQLVVKASNTTVLDNILMGDVWICSGQSNMEWTVQNSQNPVEEIKNGNHPLIRHFKVPNVVATQPADDVTGGEWKVCSPETVADFTAVGYFFARQLQNELNIPIGLINTSWGGTHVETWTSREAFENADEFKAMIALMPKFNLDSVAKIKKTISLDRIAKLQGKAIHAPEEIMQWHTPQFDDTGWPLMNVPGQFESQALGDIDGIVWIRRSIELNPEDLGKPASLSLAMIDDSDETFVNGIKVGEMKGRWDENRNYSVPSQLLRAGKNFIAIRIEDTGGGGGVHGPAELVQFTVGSKPIPLAGEWKYQVETLSGVSGLGPNSYPTLLSNAMIHPLIQLGIKGAIWYQGESNASRAYQYRNAFPLMINDWRKKWDQGNFPFYFVQLATFNADNGNSQQGSNWAELREAQALTHSLPQTGMAVTTDIGEVDNIHPRNKQDVGKRLAAIALKNTYTKNIVCQGPTFSTMKIEGDKAIIRFSNSESGLAVKDKYGYAKGFEMAGEDKKFYYAKAEIKDGQVVVFSPTVNKIIAVRYNWADDASDGNLYNKEGFPAEPFRTDAWSGITEKNKFKIE